MTARSERKTFFTTLHETGWARSRRLRGRPIRTCRRAVLDGEAGRPPRGDDRHIVRGTD
ncbi:hypothetical protein ACFRI7_30140 [Streptomyces sp. NPDC056716]|uniref:hypothetical protein n=1 Tax=unclassified Streptomyces TaxID=2593676 RepID=UPI0036994285